MKPVSIYIHWPFCLSLCPYCDFNSHISDNISVNQWIESYKQELSYFKDHIIGRRVKSIFFGGGTPSLMDPRIVESIIETISDYGSVDDNTEVTLEANPTSYEAIKFKDFKKAGVNRVSIGIQSLNDDNLRFLGRQHSSEEAIKVIKSASEIFDRYSYDLIYALPNQSLNDWKNELKNALSLSSDHISLYQLTIEKGTPFYKLYKENKFTLPSNDVSADMYEYTKEYLEQNEYHCYEISNYAKLGKECIHNLAYWNYDEYVGIGPGAHSRLHNTDSLEAIMTIHSPTRWLESVKEKGNGLQTTTLLESEEIIKECIMMGTRLKSGLLESNFYAKTGMKFNDVLNMNIVKQYQNEGFLNLDEALTLTNKGLLLHSYIVPRLF